jgi:SAM-dependent methyltransferase
MNALRAVRGVVDRWLEHPGFYKFIQWAALPGEVYFLRAMHRRLFAGSRGYVLDVGCGPRPTHPPSSGVLIGVDSNEKYIRQFTGGILDRNPKAPFGRPGSRRPFGFLADARKLPFQSGVLNETRTVGLFHHLEGDAVRKTLKEMGRCLKPGGRLIVMDSVWPHHVWSRPLAWLTRRMDRGRFVRTEKELRLLLSAALDGPWNFHRMTYTYTGLECLWAVWVKPGRGERASKSGLPNQAIKRKQS